MCLKCRGDGGLYLLHSFIAFSASSAVRLRKRRDCKFGLNKGVIGVTLTTSGQN